MSKNSSSYSIAKVLSGLAMNNQATISNQQFIDLALLVGANQSEGSFNLLDSLIKVKSIDLTKIFDQENNNILGIAVKGKSYELAGYFFKKVTDPVSFIYHKNNHGKPALSNILLSENIELSFKFTNLFVDNGFKCQDFRLIKSIKEGNLTPHGNPTVLSFIDQILQYEEGKKFLKTFFSSAREYFDYDKFFSLNCREIKLETCKFLIETLKPFDQVLFSGFSNATISNFEVAKFLLQFEEVKSQDITKLSDILHARIAEDNIKACEFLLLHCDTIKQVINAALNAAINQGSFNLVKLFIDNGATTSEFSEDYNNLNTLGIECILALEKQDITAPYYRYKLYTPSEAREKYHTDNPLFSTIPGAYFVQIVLADTNNFVQCFEKVPNFYHLLLQAKTCKLIKLPLNSDLVAGVQVQAGQNIIDAILEQKFNIVEEKETENVLGDQNAIAHDIELQGNNLEDEA